jgi:pyruvate dehydrogenase (quinone)
LPHWPAPAAATDSRQSFQVRGAIAEALVADGPAIVDCVVAADEIPNLPHFDIEQAGHYAIAKVKEAIIAATGR